ncbi:hypothetical protein [Enterobacter sp. CPE_E1214]|uniref:hypothetical protein n=1 Tax=unclassified Enterobacter TaxID=2608935 RepID=UPI0038904C56
MSFNVMYCAPMPFEILLIQSTPNFDFNAAATISPHSYSEALITKTQSVMEKEPFRMIPTFPKHLVPTRGTTTSPFTACTAEPFSALSLLFSNKEKSL